MRIPAIKGLIKRRLLVNFRADPEVVRRLLPQPFRPKLHRGYAIVGICLIRLEQMRPAGLPGGLGFSSENAAHRIAVEWPDAAGGQYEGVFVPRRDTNSFLNRVAGGRIFPGEQQPAQFKVEEHDGHIEFSMQSLDNAVSVQLSGSDSDTLPPASCFGTLLEASAFFEGGSLGYSATRDGDRYDGLLLHTLEWRVRAMSMNEVYSSFFADPERFPKGSVEFDHALVMRDTLHEWHKAADLRVGQLK
jgi:Uncharacterized conserved protein (COG2071)